MASPPAPDGDLGRGKTGEDIFAVLEAYRTCDDSPKHLPRTKGLDTDSPPSEGWKIRQAQEHRREDLSVKE